MLGFDDCPVRPGARCRGTVLASMRAAAEGLSPGGFAPTAAPCDRPVIAGPDQRRRGPLKPVAGLLKDLAAVPRGPDRRGNPRGSAPGAVPAAALQTLRRPRPRPPTSPGAERGCGLRAAGRRADIGGFPARGRSTICSERGRRDHAVPDQAGPPRWAGRPGSPRGTFAEAFRGGVSACFDDLQGQPRVGMRTLPLAVIAGPLPAHGPGLSPGPQERSVEFVVTGPRTTGNSDRGDPGEPVRTARAPAWRNGGGSMASEFPG